MSAIPSERIFAVTGLKREARIIGGRAAQIFVSGGNGDHLAERLHRAVAGGPCAIVSVGIAGGIAPGLAPGTVIIASSVLASGRRFPAADAWTESLRQRLPEARVGVVAGGSEIVASAMSKAALFDATRALTVDMESHVAAQIADVHGVPFAVLRVVADPAERSLPAAAQSALTPSGGVNVARALKTTIARPAEIGALIRTAIDAEIAFRVLARCCRLAGPRFCLPDVGELLLDVP
jgi:hopanoid-associated phosphorylase